MSNHVTVKPEAFTLVTFDAAEIRAAVVEVAALLGVTNPIEIAVDETNPLGRITSSIVGGRSSDAVIALAIQSGALEDTRHLQNFSPVRARRSIGRGLLRARDRLRDDWQDAPDDADLTNVEATAWDVYCAGRLARCGLEPNEQQYRYDFRNRFGFSDTTDRTFDRLWAADDLAWSDLPRVD